MVADTFSAFFLLAACFLFIGFKIRPLFKTHTPTHRVHSFSYVLTLLISCYLLFNSGHWGFEHRSPFGAARPHLSVDHMFWPRAIGPFLLSAGPLWIAAGRSHRWTQRGSAGGLADTPASHLSRMAAHHRVASGGFRTHPLAMKRRFK